jgi:hypothetical protein
MSESKYIYKEESNLLPPNANLPIIDLGYAKHKAANNLNDEL